MQVTLILADAAKTADGKLFVLGGGWTVCGPVPGPMAVGVILEFPPDHPESRNYEIGLELLRDDEDTDSDGQSVLSIASVTGTITVTAEDPPRTQSLVAAFNFPPLPLKPGAAYAWQLAIDGDRRSEWRRQFSVRPTSEVGGG